MIIIPSYCTKFSYNDRVEQTVADYLASVTTRASPDKEVFVTKDFSNGTPREGYDFLIGSEARNFVQLELKTSANEHIPVETHKDLAQTIPSGITTSTAPFFVTLTLGWRKEFGKVGKLRVWKRKILKHEAGKAVNKKFFLGATPSQGAVVYSVQPTKDVTHIWLADFPLVFQQYQEDGSRVMGYDLGAPFEGEPSHAAQFVYELNVARGLDE
jgi:hypothetical protein